MKQLKNIIKVSPREYKNFVKRKTNISLDKIMTIRISLSNLQYIKDKTKSYLNNKPAEKPKIKSLSIFK